MGDELWQRFLRAEKEIGDEVKDVVNEVSASGLSGDIVRHVPNLDTQANALAPNWGTYIFQSANEIHANQMTRKRVEELQAQTEAEKEWWEKKRLSVQAEFMKELETETASNSKTGTAGPATGKGSDDDTVMVESGGPAEKGHSGGKKKKKGKH